jgi:enoyl-CoA hydratase/carnithine racemase
MNSPASPSMLASAAPVVRTDAGGVATVTLNRPAQFNAISAELLDALQATLDALAVDSGVRVVVIAGAGRAFCAGHDLKEMIANSTEDFVGGLFRRCCDAMLTLARLPQPVIARVHGIATAAGCQLVAACDLAVASQEARFATSGINVGLFCSTPAVPLTRNMGRKQSFEMLMTGDFLSAEAAASRGLVNAAVPSDALDSAVAALAERIVAKSPVAVRTGKAMFYRQIEQGIAAAYDYAGEIMAGNMMAADAAEGIDAFIAKRAPRWTGG